MQRSSAFICYAGWSSTLPTTSSRPRKPRISSPCCRTGTAATDPGNGSPTDLKSRSGRAPSAAPTQTRQEGILDMAIDLLLALVVGVVIYLFYAVINPEKF
ncbi:potassium-transporting ATPase subunit F [Pseudomonas gingeri]|uniref:Potassium-transporting ATPase subunit F n=2 Tax=Pseudomonas gingeri TaxID=117681 RepID=A0A7Y8BPU2_9PSED|nr:potassium-transporting ATPase subunit F [Pseudomonas gingeri]